MWKVDDLITLEKNIDKEYDGFTWTQTLSTEMHELLELTWKDHYDIFE